MGTRLDRVRRLAQCSRRFKPSWEAPKRSAVALDQYSGCQTQTQIEQHLSGFDHGSDCRADRPCARRLFAILKAPAQDQRPLSASQTSGHHGLYASTGPTLRRKQTFLLSSTQPEASGCGVPYPVTDSQPRQQYPCYADAL